MNNFRYKITHHTQEEYNNAFRIRSDGDWVDDSDEAYSIRTDFRTNAILLAARKLGIPFDELEKADYIGRLPDEKFMDTVHAERYLLEYFRNPDRTE